MRGVRLGVRIDRREAVVLALALIAILAYSRFNWARFPTACGAMKARSIPRRAM